MRKKIFLYTIIFVLSYSCYAQDKKVTPLSSLDNKLYSSIFAGNMPDMINAIVSGANINAQDEYGDTPAISAILNKKTNLAEYLITRGANIELKNLEGDNAISSAARMGDLIVLQLLIKKNANVLNFNNNAEGLLEVAIKNKQYNLLSYLLDEKVVDINRISPINLTPLGFACLLKDTQAANLLLKYKADEDFRLNDTARTPLMISASLGDLNMLTLLMNYGVKENLTDGYGRTALAIAIASSQSKAALFLVSQKVKYDTLDVNGQTALTLAIANKLDDVAKAIIERGAGVNDANIYGQTPLMVAASHGSLSLLQYMVDEKKGNLTKIVKQSFTEVLSKEPYKAVTYYKGWNILDIAEESLQPTIVSYLIFDKGLSFNKYLDKKALEDLATNA